MASSISLAVCASPRLQIVFDLTFDFSLVPHSQTLYSRPKMIAAVCTNPPEAVLLSNPFVLSTFHYSTPTSHRKSPLKSYFFPWLNGQAWKTPWSHYRGNKFTEIHQSPSGCQSYTGNCYLVSPVKQTKLFTRNQSSFLC